MSLDRATDSRGVTVAAPDRRFVSRGGEKLEAALDALGIEVVGRRVLDAGASTGGFTDVVLVRGATSVVAVDVAYGQFDWRLRNDARVEVHERTNVRAITAEAAGAPVDLIVADLSFIDLRKVRAAFEAVSTPEADAVLLVKPQFELPRGEVPRGGVVRESASWRHALELVAGEYRAHGWTLQGACASPVVGPKGNREFFVWLRRGGVDAGEAPLDQAVSEAP